MTRSNYEQYDLRSPLYDPVHALALPTHYLQKMSPPG